MSTENPTSDVTAEPMALSPEEYAAKLAETEAKLLTLLDRGHVNQRLFVPLPAGVYGEWVRNDPVEVERFRAMGFEIDDKYAASNATSGNNRIADVVHMVAPKYVKDAIDKIRNRRFEEMHGKAGQKRRTNLKEERDFGSKVDFPVVNESVNESISGNDIASAINPASVLANVPT